MSAVRIYTCFDVENDRDLYVEILDQAQRGGSGFEISAASEGRRVSGPWEARVRRRVRDADEVIVVCGEHTADSECVREELRIVQEEDKPYFLLWGRRGRMCTRPDGVRPADSMYSWTREILRDQIFQTLRNAQPLEIPDSLKRAPSTR